MPQQEHWSAEEREEQEQPQQVPEILASCPGHRFSVLEDLEVETLLPPEPEDRVETERSDAVAVEEDLARPPAAVEAKAETVS
jgi:hypothetical protein